MARQLWLLRHGDAEPHGSRHDTDRPLTDKGRRQSDVAARALEHLGCHFDVILTSPRVRARDTARSVGDRLGLEPLIHQPLNAGFDAEQAVTVLGGLPDDARLLLVGHNPDFEQIIHDLTGARVDFKKGGVAAIRVDGTGFGELVMLLRPREIERIADQA